MMASKNWLDLEPAEKTQPAPESQDGALSQEITLPALPGPAAAAGFISPAVLAGAMSGQSFDYAVQFSDPNNYAGSLAPAIEADMNAALQSFEGKIQGAGSLVVQLDIISGSTSNAGELADGGPTALVPQGTLDGRVLAIPSSIHELLTGTHIAGYGSDIIVEVPSSALGELYFAPNPAAGDSIASVAPSKYDGLTVFRHELTHGLGFISLRDTATGTLGSVETEFDHYSSITSAGADVFTGPAAEAIYGAPVPVTTIHNGEQYSHLGNDLSGPLASDLMGGTGLMNGVTHQVSALDLAILGDIGVPETGSLPCFAAGTRLATPGGEVPVEELRQGDMVLLAKGGEASILWTGSRRVDLAAHSEPERVAPVVIASGAFADGLPSRALAVSPDHALFFEGTLIPAKALLNGVSIRQVHPSVVVYFHIELAQHDVILAEGIPAESFLDTDNRFVFSGLAPFNGRDATQREQARQQRSCAPLAESGPVVEALRAQILDRAAIATTGNPALSISAGPAALTAVFAAPDLVEVPLPAEVGDLVIKSRNFVPGEIGRDPRDRRRLGIAVSALELRDTNGWRPISLSDPALRQGWHAEEPGYRWTNGRGLIAAHALAGASRLRMRFQAGNHYRRRA